MVLVFMISASWRLTIVTFVLVPFIMVLCKLYGAYYKKLSKKVQTALAEANTVAEEAISSMTTVGGGRWVFFLGGGACGFGCGCGFVCCVCVCVLGGC